MSHRAARPLFTLNNQPFLLRTFPKTVYVNELDRAELDWEQQKRVAGSWKIFGLENERRLLTVLIVIYFIPNSPRGKKNIARRKNTKIENLEMCPTENEGGFLFIHLKR